jgi:2'-phosphotransferase
VNSNLVLNLLSQDEVAALPTVVHGTFRDLFEKFIRVQGLKRMSRNHIHFAAGLPKDGSVISGMRKSCDVYIFIDTKKCAKDNIQFFRSDNGVILCAGIGDEGVLPTTYFSNVTDASGQSLMKINFD